MEIKIMMPDEKYLSMTVLDDNVVIWVEDQAVAELDIKDLTDMVNLLKIINTL